jgi:hypothetical protein
VRLAQDPPAETEVLLSGCRTVTVALSSSARRNRQASAVLRRLPSATSRSTHDVTPRLRCRIGRAAASDRTAASDRAAPHRLYRAAPLYHAAPRRMAPPHGAAARIAPHSRAAIGVGGTLLPFFRE